MTPCDSGWHAARKAVVSSAPLAGVVKDLKRGKLIGGKYRLERSLDAGGMGQIWIAHSIPDQKDVAIKLMAAALQGAAQAEVRFKQEAKRLNLKDVVRANKAGCLDHCALGPSVVIYPEGVWYTVRTESDVTEIMERHVIKGEVVTRLLMPDHPAPTPLLPLSSLR